MYNPKATAAMQWNVEGDVYRAVLALDYPWFRMGVVHGLVHDAVRRSVNRGVSSAVELAAYRSFDHRALQDFLQETKSSWKGRG